MNRIHNLFIGTILSVLALLLSFDMGQIALSLLSLSVVLICPISALISKLANRRFDNENE
mgnify:FL=1